MIVRIGSEEEKRKAIIANLDKSMMIEAGAGAGKTSLVVKRNIEQLKKGFLEAKDLVDITFTNAAAESLRSRLLKELHEEAEKPEITEEERNRLNQAISDESLIQISTIHSFCKRILTEQSFAARLPLDVKQLDNEEATNRKTMFFYRWYKKLDLNELKEKENEFYYGNFGEFVYRSFLDICELPEDIRIKYRKDLLENTSVNLDSFKNRMIKQAEDCLAIILRIVANRYPEKGYGDLDSISDCVCKKYIDIKRELQDIKNTNELVKNYKEWQKYWSKGEKAFKSAKRKMGIEKIDAEEMNGEFNNQIVTENIMDELEVYQNALVIDMAMKARNEYREYCRKPENRHEITNDALLQEALLLVKNNPDAREYFQNRFSCIYVDEFQDTDIVQRDLIELLCTNEQNKIRPGSLFFVGDPKQSIYAFRGADVGVYEETKSHYCDDAVTDVEEYVLNYNFRSEKPIVDWVNSTFSGRFADILSGGYTEMKARHDNKGGSGEKIIRGVYRLDYPIYSGRKENIYGAAKEAKKKESVILVSIIRHLTEDGFKIWDNKLDTFRKILYGDFLILCQKKDDINLYADQLKNAGISINLYGALDVEEEDVLLRLNALYRGITYPYDKKARYGAEEVLVGDIIKPDNHEKAKQYFDILIDRTQTMSGYELLQYLCHHIEYLLGGEVTGVMAVRAQSRLQQLLEAVMAERVGSRKIVLERIQKYRRSDVDKELSLEKDADAVRFMNLHKAKGLEGKIVIICARGYRKDHKEAYREKDLYYPLAKNSYYIEYTSYAGNDEIVEKVNQKKKHEQIRQEYVAATRAEEALIFMDGLGSDCLFNDYDPELTNESVNNLLDISEDIRNDYEKALQSKYEISKSSEGKEEYDTSCWDGVSVPEQKKHQFLSITPNGMESGDKDSWKPGDDKVERPTGEVFGKVIHRCFELTVRKIRKEEEPDPKAIINQAIMEYYNEVSAFCTDDDRLPGLFDLYRSYLEKKVNDFLGRKELLERIRNSEAVYTEMGFSMYADPKEVMKVDSGLRKKLKTDFAPDADEPYWINGRADLVLVDADNKVQIIDYKSDHIGSKSVEELESHLSHCYDAQQELYRFALSRTLNVPVSDITYQYYHLYGE